MNSGTRPFTLPVKNLSKSLHLVVDSTGVKVYGEGEWKVRQHGIGKRRTWRKLHFCVDEATAETQVFRFKTIFGDRLQTRQIDNQFKELMLKSAILNRMTYLGMPDSVKVNG